MRVTYIEGVVTDTSGKQTTVRFLVDSGTTYTLGQTMLKCIHHHTPFTETVKAAEGMSHFGGDIELAYNFIDLIREKDESKVDIRMGLRSVYASLAAKKSAETGKFIDLTIY